MQRWNRKVLLSICLIIISCLYFCWFNCALIIHIARTKYKKFMKSINSPYLIQLIPLNLVNYVLFNRDHCLSQQYIRGRVACLFSNSSLSCYYQNFINLSNPAAATNSSLATHQRQSCWKSVNLCWKTCTVSEIYWIRYAEFGIIVSTDPDE